ncbi:MAG: nicotinate (nicotinamide) nucleotide adenylyltransferase [Desulfosarcina sp.]|nr:nicotinate (nicotinamide) nucleotide adenylyltransferase [Desulfobacterales bacterium]
MRTGLFGGTFNPIHLGHLKAIKRVKEEFPLDKIYIIPSAIPPHKDRTDVADHRARYEMVHLAIENDPLIKKVDISDVELTRSGPSYTIDTVMHYKSIMPADSSLYLILGLDAFLELNTWKSYMELLDIIPFLVIARPGSGNYKKKELYGEVEEFLLTKISDRYRYNLKIKGYIHENKETVFVFDAAPLDISSTMIRSHVGKGKAINALVPPAVESFINKRRLYV